MFFSWSRSNEEVMQRVGKGERPALSSLSLSLTCVFVKNDERGDGGKVIDPAE